MFSPEERFYRSYIGKVAWKKWTLGRHPNSPKKYGGLVELKGSVYTKTQTLKQKCVNGSLALAEDLSRAQNTVASNTFPILGRLFQLYWTGEEICFQKFNVMIKQTGKKVPRLGVTAALPRKWDTERKRNIDGKWRHCPRLEHVQ